MHHVLSLRDCIIPTVECIECELVCICSVIKGSLRSCTGTKLVNVSVVSEPRERNDLDVRVRLGRWGVMMKRKRGRERIIMREVEKENER